MSEGGLLSDKFQGYSNEPLDEHELHHLNHAVKEGALDEERAVYLEQNPSEARYLFGMWEAKADAIRKGEDL